jgi:hypothetical protein
MAAVFRNMGAIIDRVYLAAVGLYGHLHIVMDLLKLCLRNKFAIDHRLVGNHNDPITMEGEELQGVKAPRQEDEFGPPLNVIGPILVDHPISIHKNNLQILNLPFSDGLLTGPFPSAWEPA